MKANRVLLALCVLGSGFVYGQTTNTNSTNSGSSTTTTTTTTDPNNTSTTTNSTTTDPANTNTNSSTNMNSTTNPTNNQGTMNNQGTTNSQGTTNMNSTTGQGTYNNSSTNTNGSTMSPSTTTGSDMNTSTGSSTYNSSTTTTSSSGMNDVNRSNDVNRTSAWKKGRFGIYAGVNRSNFVTEENNLGSEARYGYQLGVYGRSGGSVFGQLGVEFRSTTSQVYQRGTVSGSTIRDNLDQQFLAIPAYIGWRIGNALGLRIQAGAEVSALVGRGSDLETQLNLDAARRAQLNGLVGAGINLGPLTLDINYNHGLSRLWDEGSDFKRRMVAANVGLRF